MTDDEMNAEIFYVYSNRLGERGYGPNDAPTAKDHNEAVEEAKAHAAKLRDAKQERQADMFNEIRRSLL